MTYILFKKLIHTDLRKRAVGKTWKELKTDLALPYKHPCPEWVRSLEHEIGLTRKKGTGRALVWRIKHKK